MGYVDLKAVMLDMDGTITRFNLDSRKPKLAILKELEALNLRSPDMTETSSILSLLKQMKKRLDVENYERFRNRLYDLLEEMEVKAAEKSELHPGVFHTLQGLKERDIRLGLVTNNSRHATDLTIKRLKLSVFFDAIITRDDCQEMKPDPSPVEKALTILRIRADEAIFVGDSVNDILAAKEAGLSSVAVSTGTSSTDQLLRCEPDYLLASLNDLLSLIDVISYRNA